MGGLLWLLVACLLAVHGAQIKIQDVVATGCDIQAVKTYASLAVNQLLRCESPAVLVSIEDVPGLELGPDTTRSLMLPFLQVKARERLAAAVAAGRSLSTLRVTQAFNSVVDAYVLWRWVAGGRCGLKIGGEGSVGHDFFPLRPKDVGTFASGTAVELASTALATEWASLLSQYGWVREGTTALFTFRAPIGDLVDVHYRQVAMWQRWFSSQNSQLGLAASGVFDATTQERMDGTSASGMSLMSTCEVTLAASREGKRASSSVSNPGAVNNGASPGSLALVIAVPLGVVAFTLAVLIIAMVLFGMGGPRLPMASKSRGHADPNWLPQVLGPEGEVVAAPEVVEEDHDFYADPVIWSEISADVDTTELEERLHGGKNK